MTTVGKNVATVHIVLTRLLSFGESAWAGHVN